MSRSRTTRSASFPLLDRAGLVLEEVDVGGAAGLGGERRPEVEPLVREHRLRVALGMRDRVTATSTIGSGFAVETVQSLPKASGAPARTRLPNG